MKKSTNPSSAGYWVGVSIDPETGLLKGAASEGIGGAVIAP